MKSLYIQIGDNGEICNAFDTGYIGTKEQMIIEVKKDFAKYIAAKEKQIISPTDTKGLINYHLDELNKLRKMPVNA